MTCGGCGAAVERDDRLCVCGWTLRRPLEPSDAQDHGDEPEVDGDRLLRVGRVYRFDLDAFSEADREALDRAYRELPGWIGYGDGARWLALEDEPPFLWSSVEPPGLEAGGVIGARSWAAWDAAFRARVMLPVRPRGD